MHAIKRIQAKNYAIVEMKEYHNMTRLYDAIDASHDDNCTMTIVKTCI